MGDRESHESHQTEVLPMGPFLHCFASRTSKSGLQVSDLCPASLGPKEVNARYTTCVILIITANVS